MLKDILNKEIYKIKDYPESVKHYMEKEENWIILESDCIMEEIALFSYPDEIYILSIKNAGQEIKDFFSSFGKYKEDYVLTHNKYCFTNDDCNFEEIDDEEYENMNYHCVFLYFYRNVGSEEELINQELFETKSHCYIFNGLELSRVEEEEQALKALNVKNYEVF